MDSFLKLQALCNKEQKANWADMVFVIQATKPKANQAVNSVTASLGLQTGREEEGRQDRQLVARADPIFTYL